MARYKKRIAQHIKFGMGVAINYKIAVLGVCLLWFIPMNELLAQEKRVSVDFQNEKIEDILIEIASSNGYDIVFNNSYFDSKIITIQVKDQPISSVLEKVLIGTDVDISIKRKTIFLEKIRRLYGFVKDKKSSEVLINATIFDPISGKGTISNEAGYFYFELPYENNFIVSSYVGYHPDTIFLGNNTSHPLEIKMETNTTFDVIVVAKDQQTKNIEQALGKKDLMTNKVKTLYATGGEPDVFQYLFTKPGIATGPDGLGGVHVRGSDVSHNLFLFDGVKVYTPFHSLGLFSIFDINQLKHANFYKYGFHPKHGGNLASVLELNAKEGDYENWNSHVSFSTLASHVGVDGPLVEDKLSLSVYARRTHLDFLIKDRTEKEKQEDFEEGYSNHYFYDINTKLQYKIGLNDRLSLSAYTGKDIFMDKTDDYYIDEFIEISDTSRNDIDWQNQLAVLKWNHLYGKRLFSNLRLSYSSFKYQSVYRDKYYHNEFGFEEYSESNLVQFFSGINELGLDLDFEFFPNDKHQLSFGTGLHRVNYKPGVGRDSLNSMLSGGIHDSDQYNFDDNLENSYSSDEFHVYFRDKWNIRKDFFILLGARYSKFMSENIIYDISSNFDIIQANVLLHWTLLENLSWTLSFDRMEQPIHLLSTSNIGFPNDLWLPSIENIEPEESFQVNMGIQYRLSDNISFNLDGYVKQMDNLLRFKEFSAIPSLFIFNSNFWEAEVSSGESNSRGLELESIYEDDGLRASIGLSFSKADRKFEEFNDNGEFPYAFDQRFKISANIYKKMADNFWIYGNWSFFNGLNQTLYSDIIPFTPLENFWPPPEDRISDINGYQQPDVYRLDLGIIWRKEYKAFKHELQLGVQNVFNRKNTIFSYFEEDEFFPQESGIKNIDGLPILPSISYKLSFSKEE